MSRIQQQRKREADPQPGPCAPCSLWSGVSHTLALFALSWDCFLPPFHSQCNTVTYNPLSSLLGMTISTQLFTVKKPVDAIIYSRFIKEPQTNRSVPYLSIIHTLWGSGWDRILWTVPFLLSSWSLMQILECTICS